MDIEITRKEAEKLQDGDIITIARVKYEVLGKPARVGGRPIMITAKPLTGGGCARNFQVGVHKITKEEGGKMAKRKGKVFTDGDYSISQGTITYKGTKIGEAMIDFKFGYHPAVKVTVGANHTWFEQDEKELYKKIVDWAAENKEGL